VVQTFRRTAFINTFSQLVNYLFPLLTFPLLVKAFETTLYGMWIEAGALVGFLTILVSAGVGNAVAALIPGKTSDEAAHIYSNALYITFGLCGSVVLITVLAAPIINTILIRAPLGVGLIRIVALLILVNAINVLGSQMCRVRQMPVLDAILNVALAVGKLVAVVFAAVQRDLVTFSVVYVAGQAALTALQIFLVYRGISLRRFSWPETRRLLKFGANLGITGQVNWIVMYGDRLLLSILASTAAVAIYSASYQLTFILVALSSPYVYALLPILGERWHAHDVAGAQMAIRHSTRAMMLVLTPGIIGLALTGNALLRLLATDAFAQGGLLVGLIALGIAIDALNSNLQLIFFVQGRPKVLRIVYIQAAILNLCANLIAIPLFSYYGAGITTLFTFVFIIVALWKRTEMPLSALFDFSVLMRCLLASAIMSLWVLATVGPGIPRLMVAMVGGAIIYFIGVTALRVVSIVQIRQMLGSRNPL
jgi:O-antigen/teichoic acid export membrane protein